jgi:lipoprotein NlpI
LRLRLGTAPVDFAENLSGWPDGWMKTIGQFVAGQLDATALLAVAGSGDSGPAKARRSVADYYIGISQLLKGDQAGAKASFQDSLAVGDKMTDEYQLSRAELAKLKDSSQP